MTRLLWFIPAVFLMTGIALIQASRGLPHRQQWEVNHGQGRNPDSSCPGQHATTVEVDDHAFFLECYGTKEGP